MIRETDERPAGRSMLIRYLSETPLDLLFAILAVAGVVIAVVWFWRRRRLDCGLLCWNCGADLGDKRLYVDFRGRSRCPKCGNEMDVTDTYQMPRGTGDPADR